MHYSNIYDHDYYQSINNRFGNFHNYRGSIMAEDIVKYHDRNYHTHVYNSKFNHLMDVSGTGLSAQRIRLSTISSNISNAETTRVPGEEGPYKRKDVSFKYVVGGYYDGGVRVEKIVEDTKPPRLKYEPDHPEANEEGYVAYPNIHIVEEMVNMIEASRSYEANVTVLNTAKESATKSLEIGKA